MEPWLTRMKQRLDELKLRQEDLAQRIGITRSAVCHYLSGRRVPALKQMEKIAVALECEPVWLQYGITKDAVPPSQTAPVTRAKGGGGKLNRCMIIQARLDPKLHEVAEMMALKQRRTLSNLIEILIENEAERYGQKLV